MKLKLTPLPSLEDFSWDTYKTLSRHCFEILASVFEKYNNVNLFVLLFTGSYILRTFVIYRVFIEKLLNGFEIDKQYVLYSFPFIF